MKLCVSKNNANKYVNFSNEYLCEYDITTYRKVAHFVAQLLTESGNFVATKAKRQFVWLQKCKDLC